MDGIPDQIMFGLMKEIIEGGLVHFQELLEIWYLVSQAKLILGGRLNFLAAGQKVGRTFEAERKQQIDDRLDFQVFAELTANGFTRRIRAERYLTVRIFRIHKHRTRLHRHCEAAALYVYYPIFTVGAAIPAPEQNNARRIRWVLLGFLV